MFRGRDVHVDGILVPYPPIPADFTAVPALILVHPRKKLNPSPQAPAYFCQPKAVITVTTVAVRKIPHSAALTVSFQTEETRQFILWNETKIKGIHHRLVSILVTALVMKSLYYVMVQCGVPAVIKSIPLESRKCRIHPRGIPATFIPTPVGNPRIPRDSRRPHPRAHLYYRRLVTTRWAVACCI